MFSTPHHHVDYGHCIHLLAACDLIVTQYSSWHRRPTRHWDKVNPGLLLAHHQRLGHIASDIDGMQVDDSRKHTMASLLP